MAQTWSESSATCGWSFKQLQDASQEQVLVAVNMHALPLGSDFGTPYFRLAAASEFVAKPPFAAGCMINTRSPLAILCSSLLLCCAGPRSLLIRFSAGLSWPSNQLSVDRKLVPVCLQSAPAWQEVCELFLLRAFEQQQPHLSLSLAGL